MSRIAKNVTQIMKMSVNNKLFANLLQNSGKSLNKMRGLSTVVANNSFNSRNLKTTQINVVSKRFAANSPEVDQELTQFLTSEIEFEKKEQKKVLPKIDGWNISSDGSNIVFEKTYGNEKITVRTNINHSVDQKNYSEDSGEGVPTEMVCRPEFAVEIKKNNMTLGVNCSFVDTEDFEEEQANNPEAKEEKQSLEDEFQINEFSLFEGDFKENSYVVSGDVMDGAMYDLMMDLLHERGVDHSFARSLIDYTTVYDHHQYIGLLVKLKDFFSKK